MSKFIFLAAVIIAASGIISPPIALLAGLIYGFTLAASYQPDLRKWTKYLLQGSVVALGFGMDLHQVLRAGRSGFVYTVVGITFAMVLGLGLGFLLHVSRKAAFLISTGTAICGGSAIAAVAPITNASEEEIAVSLGAVFILNSIALFLFPPVGAALHLTQVQFGLWSALAIHDTSSVVGATAKFGAEALAVGTTVKLARALWIVPLSLATAVALKQKTKIQWPWFILFFCLAALLNTLAPSLQGAFAMLNHAGRLGLTLTLFLIGTGLNKETLRSVGFRPLLQALLLWLVVGAGTLALIVSNWIRL